MSKKHKRQRQKQKKNFPWLLLACGGVLIAAAAFLFASNQAASDQGGGSDNGGGTPALTVDRQKIDFGDQKLGTNLTFAIQVTNTGDGTLRFQENPYIEVLEGC